LKPTLVYAGKTRFGVAAIDFFLSVRPAQPTKTFISFVASCCETYLCGSAALLLYGAESVRENNCLLVRNSRATSFGWRFSPSTA
jgi:hypothetical protein